MHINQKLLLEWVYCRGEKTEDKDNFVVEFNENPSGSITLNGERVEITVRDGSDRRQVEVELDNGIAYEESSGGKSIELVRFPLGKGHIDFLDTGEVRFRTY